jgi:hypothetical protein
MESRVQIGGTMFEAKDVAFLESIGCTAQELFDFVDDALSYHDLDFETGARRHSDPARLFP